MSNANFLKTLRIDPKETAYLDRQTASSGNIAYDKQEITLRVFDGTVKGGHALARADLENIAVSNYRSKSVDSKLATVIYAVTIVGPQGGDVGNKYMLNGVYRPILNFVVGYTYVFVQDNATNVYFPNANGTTINQHPLNFSADNLSGNNGGGTSYLTDVQYFLDNVSVTQAVYNSNRFATATARQVRITVTNSTPALLYYWCWNHSAMGNYINAADPGSGSGRAVSISATQPSLPTEGNLWLDSNTGILYVYFDDGDSEHWIQPSFAYPDTTNLATVSYVNSTVAALPGIAGLATTSFVNTAVSAGAFVLSVQADDSTSRSIPSGSTVQFTGAGGITTTSDSAGNIIISPGNVIGNIVVNSNAINSIDSTAITIVPAVNFESDVVVGNDLVFVDGTRQVTSATTFSKALLAMSFFIKS